MLFKFFGLNLTGVDQDMSPVIYCTTNFYNRLLVDECDILLESFCLIHLLFVHVSGVVLTIYLQYLV